VICSVIGDLAIKHGMKLAGEIHDLHPRAFFQSMRRALLGGWVMLGVVAMIAAFLALLALLSGAAASSVIPATAGTFVLDTLGARLLLRERVGRARWL